MIKLTRELNSSHWDLHQWEVPNGKWIIGPSFTSFEEAMGEVGTRLSKIRDGDLVIVEDKNSLEARRAQRGK